MSTKKLDVVILAAGKGTRMRSDLPKVLHTVGGKPFLTHVVECAETLSATNISVVVGHGSELVKKTMEGRSLNFIEQTEQLGTGHAVQQALPYLDEASTTLILYGDVPLISPDTLRNLLEKVSNNSMGLLTMIAKDPTGYGRIIRDAENNVTAIVEQKDASEEQKLIQEVNTGVMAVATKDLQNWLPQLTDNNAQKEYLLTDIIALAASDGVSIETAHPASEAEVLGVNNRAQQAELERIYQQGIADDLMQQGLTLLDPSRFDCRGSLKVGRDCVIDVNCVFEGECELGDGVVIGPNCHIVDSTIASNVEIKSHTILEQALVGNNATIGPFARLRPQANLADGAKVGNFVEIKKANIGEGSKVNHLSYVGDANVGAGVNIGAGTITCNYDGANKFVTEIGDGVFVGSNSALVAPVKLGKNVTVGAGSTITTDVQDGALTVARSRQRNIDGWERPKKK